MVTNTRYRKVIKLRERDRLTFEAIGKKIGVTRQRAQAIYKRATSRKTISTSNTNHQTSLSA